MKRELKIILLKCGVFLSVVLNFFMLIIFYIAHLNGGKVVITVNSFGEGLLEAVIVFPVIGVFLAWVLYNIVRE